MSITLLTNQEVGKINVNSPADGYLYGVVIYDLSDVDIFNNIVIKDKEGVIIPSSFSQVNLLNNDYTLHFNNPIKMQAGSSVNLSLTFDINSNIINWTGKAGFGFVFNAVTTDVSGTYINQSVNTHTFYGINRDITSVSDPNYGLLLGGSYNDTLSIPESADYKPTIVAGGDGNDSITAPMKSITTIIGGTGNDQINITGDEFYTPLTPNQIYAGDGNDTVNGAGGNLYVYGGKGKDLINGSQVNGVNNLYGNEGNDTINGGNSNDNIFGGTGNDIINGREGNDYIADESGNDKIVGGSGDDTIYGGSGNDTINGGAGNDTIFF